MSANHYKTLEVTPSADQAAIKQSYRRLVKLLHPDSHSTSASHEAIANLNAAYEVLSDPQQRCSYDRQLGYTVPNRRPSQQRNPNPAAKRRHTGKDADLEIHQWLKQVYHPVNRKLCRILNSFQEQLDELAADPFDEELMQEFQDYLEDCQGDLEDAEQVFRSMPNPSSVAGSAANLYHCLNQVGDGLEEIERFTYCYAEHYLHTGQELFRIAHRLRREAQASIRHLIV